MQEEPPQFVQKNANGYRCHLCNSEYHLKSDCPLATLPELTNGGSGGGSNTESEPSKDDNWRYCAPADENAVLIVRGLKYYFCKHCVCKRTKKKGFFNRTHTSSKTATTDGHRFPKGTKTEAEADTVATSISSLSEGNLGSVSKPPPLAPVVDDTVIDGGTNVNTPIPAANDPNGLEFVGAFLAECPDDNAAWVAHTPDPPSMSLTFGVSAVTVDNHNNNSVHNKNSVTLYNDPNSNSPYFFDALSYHNDTFADDTLFFDTFEEIEPASAPLHHIRHNASWCWNWFISSWSSVLDMGLLLGLYALVVWWDTIFSLPLHLRFRLVVSAAATPRVYYGAILDIGCFSDPLCFRPSPMLQFFPIDWVTFFTAHGIVPVGYLHSLLSMVLRCMNIINTTRPSSHRSFLLEERMVIRLEETMTLN